MRLSGYKWLWLLDSLVLATGLASRLLLPLSPHPPISNPLLKLLTACHFRADQRSMSRTTTAHRATQAGYSGPGRAVTAGFATDDAATTTTLPGATHTDSGGAAASHVGQFRLLCWCIVDSVAVWSCHDHIHIRWVEYHYAHSKTL